MLIQKLYQAGVIHPPKFLPDNTQFLCQMGSVAYGVSTDNSDVDVYGFCVPPKDLIFPHVAGVIPGFGTQIQRFEVWQEHHVKAPDAKTEYDFSVYSIVKFFHLCMENNPNMINALFVPRRCVLHTTALAEHVRDQRTLFLHKGSWHKFKGYAYAQLHKLRNHSNKASPKRQETIEKYGYDTKFAYHIVRLLGEVEQIMVEGDLDLERNREQLKSIRRGEWTLDHLETYFVEKERALEEVYSRSTLRHSPDEARIKQILMECLEMHYGSLDKLISRDTSSINLVREIETVLAKYR